MRAALIIAITITSCNKAVGLSVIVATHVKLTADTAEVCVRVAPWVSDSFRSHTHKHTHPCWCVQGPLTCLRCRVSSRAPFFCAKQQGRSLVLYYCDYDLCWRQAIQHSVVETWNCNSVFFFFFGTGLVKVATTGRKSGPARSLPHQYSPDWTYSSIRCSLPRLGVVWHCCKQRRRSLNRCKMQLAC